MRLSLQGRLLVAALLILLGFTALTGLALDRAFRESAEAALKDRLEGYMFALLAATEVSEDGTLSFSRALPDLRFEQPGSGLYALVRRAKNQGSLRTPSVLGVQINMPASPPVGQGRFMRIEGGDGKPLFAYSYTAKWVYGPKRQYPVGYFVVEDMAGYERQIALYRRNLWGWLGAAAVLLLGAQGLILRWGLRPLRQVEREVAEIEAGRSESLHGTYPRELSGLTRNLNALLKSAGKRLTRYRDALGNVSHSLKTPLTVLRGALSGGLDESFRQTAAEQLDRMQQIIDYHLRRASAAGRQQLIKPLAVQPALDKIIRTLRKSYAAKEVDIQCLVNRDLAFHGDVGDLYEILGNLMDNAFKWCRRRIRLTASREADKSFRLEIEDDGPGIAAPVAERMLERGRRADPAVEGQGIGLAMVHETVLLYGGALTIDKSRLGGAAITIRIP